MRLPDPRPGLVIRYAYLWRDEAQRGQESGLKDRPCVIILAVHRQRQRTRIVVARVTHRRPGPGEGIEIPLQTKQRLGLDAERSWVVTTEVNIFDWPGPDLRPINGGVAYGFLPYHFARQVIDGVLECARRGRLQSTPRGEDEPRST